MNFKNFSILKALELQKAHKKALEKLSMLPNGNILADRYNNFISTPDLLRYGVLLPLLFEDFLDLGTPERKKVFEEIHVQLLCIYAFVLDLDDVQDQSHQKSLTHISIEANIQEIHQSLAFDHKDQQRTVWQSMIIGETRSIFETQTKMGLNVGQFAKQFDEAIKKAYLAFVQESIEEKKPGRLKEKLFLAADKNQMIMALAALLSPLTDKNSAEVLCRIAAKMMLPIQLIDDLYDWWTDYTEKKHTALLRDVSGWGMSKEELYVFLVNGGYFQQMLKRSIFLLIDIIQDLQKAGKGKILQNLFLSLKQDLIVKLQQDKEFYLFIKKKEVQYGNA